MTMSDAGTFAVPGKPPPRPGGRKPSRVADRRGSLPTNIKNADISRLKLGRYQSQPKLSRDEGGGSMGDILLHRGRSSSFTQLDSFKKTLSASNLAALSDSNLSITKALPLKSYDKPNTASSALKDQWEQLVHRYFFQITDGCGNKFCRNKFCASSKDKMVLNEGNAVIVSIQLASHQRQYICSSEKSIGRCLPKDALQPEKDQSQPFLHSLYSCTPFASLFIDKGDSDETDYFTHKKTTSIKASSFDNLISTNKKKQCKVQHFMRVPQSLADSKQVVSSKHYDVIGVPPKLPATTQRSELKSEESSSNQLRSVSIDLSKVGGGAIANVQSAVDLDHGHHSYDTLARSVSGNQLSNSYHTSLTSSGMSLHSSLHSSSLSNTLPFTPSPIPSHEALAETDDLVAFERSLSREMSLETPSEFSLTHLTLNMLQGPIDHYKQCSDPSFLINTIRTVFTSSDALNNSFLLKEEDSNSGVDLDEVGQAYQLLLNLYPSDVFQSTMNNSLEILMSSIHPASVHTSEINQFQILLANPLFVTSHELLRKLCSILAAFCTSTRETLLTVLSNYDKGTFQKLINMFKVHLSAMLHPQQGCEDNLIDVAKVLEILYDANTVCGKKLATCEQFYSDELSRKLDYKTEYSKWRLIHDGRSNATNASAVRCSTSLLNFPFLLNPASKVHVLHFDAVLQMRQEYQSAILHQARVNQAQKYIREGSRFNKISDCVKSAICPFLVLDIRRDYLIPDTMAQIRSKQADLKKPLKIKYIGGGEQGLDMGGLQKEFFQMLTASIFEPSYGMFQEAEETRLLWINGGSLESNDEFELVGIILGLAIYNGIILDVHFPNLIYKKLHGVKLGLEDLKEIEPTLARSLQALLDYEDDVEETFCRTFQISVNCFSHVITVDLIPNGSQVSVTNQNRQMYVDCYVKYILTDSVAKQFEAFSRGFHLVCGGPALKLFQAEEIELLVCGNPELDFKALETSTTYEDGFTRHHRTIKAFWSIVHSLNETQKKKLLNFITGSDRVPVKGLSSLPIVVQRHGPDSDRLPTAMTCFNRLLLPSYSSKEKLRNRLTIALENGKGFGLT